MSKTCREWLMQLPRPIRGFAIQNTKDSDLKIMHDTLDEAITEAFNWNDAKYGGDHLYWFRIRGRILHGEFSPPKEKSLLEQSYERYPIGTMYKTSRGRSVYTVESQKFKLSKPDVVFGEENKGVLYDNGAWAEILK